MKLTRVLFLLAIGTIACTASASTPMPETKQKPTFELSYQVYPNVVDVLSFQIVNYDVATIFPGYETQIYVVRNSEPVQHFAVIVDVGWQCLKRNYKHTPYTEKLHSNYLIDQEKELRKIGVTLSRSDC